MPVTHNGVSDFAWPIDATEILSVRDQFLAVLIPFLKRSLVYDRQALVLSLIGTYLFVEVLSIYKAQTTIRRLKEMGLEPVVAQDSRLLGAMLTDSVPQPNWLLDYLSRGISQVPDWRRFARLARGVFYRGPVRHRSIASVNMENDIVTVAQGDMIQQHAEAIAEQVTYIGFGAWFSPLLHDDKPVYGGVPNHELIDTVIDMVRTTFAERGEPLQDNSATYLRSWIRTAATLADRYLSRLLTSPEIIPRRLWRGTGGHVFSRLLSHATREVGGEVIGHDHAHGQGFFSSYSSTVIEHPFCDYFMVWTQLQRKLELRNLRPDLAVPDLPPTIDVVSGIFRPKIIDSSHSKPKSVGRPRKIMYVGTLYNDEFTPITPLIPDIVLIDWEARLIGKLREWGFDVIIKPHPESRFETPAAYEEQLGAKVVTGRFEDVYRQADVILFSQPNSTPFFSILGTHHPFVLVDTGVHTWQSEAIRMLAQRCGIVTCGRDAKNRLTTDWDVLRTAILKAPMLMDQTFLHSFFSSNN